MQACTTKHVHTNTQPPLPPHPKRCHPLTHPPLLTCALAEAVEHRRKYSAAAALNVTSHELHASVVHLCDPLSAPWPLCTVSRCKQMRSPMHTDWFASKACWSSASQRTTNCRQSKACAGLWHPGHTGMKCGGPRGPHVPFIAWNLDACATSQSCEYSMGNVLFRRL